MPIVVSKTIEIYEGEATHQVQVERSAYPERGEVFIRITNTLTGGTGRTLATSTWLTADEIIALGNAMIENGNRFRQDGSL